MSSRIDGFLGVLHTLCLEEQLKGPSTCLARIIAHRLDVWVFGLVSSVCKCCCPCPEEAESNCKNRIAWQASVGQDLQHAFIKTKHYHEPSDLQKAGIP